MSALILKTFRFPENTCISQAQPKHGGAVTLASPALNVMTDLALVRAATVEPDTLLDKAEQTMIQKGVRSLFVVNDFPCVAGLVTAADVLGEKPMRQVTLRNIQRHDLRVADVMTRLSDLDALDYDELKSANVGDVITAFKKVGHTHFLVVQAATEQGPARIRGVISITQVERQLGRAVHAVQVEA